MRPYAWLLCLLATAALAREAPGQLAPVSVPRGLFRLDLQGSLEDYHQRFRDGETEDVAADFASPALGSDRLGELGAAEARIAQVLGRPGYRLNLGRLEANGQATVGTIQFGLAYGLTSRLTLFGTLPLVRARSELRLALDPAAANAGANPNDPVLGSAEGRAAAATFFSEFDASLATLSAKIANGDYDADPALRALAQSTLAGGTALRDGLQAIITDPATASTFLPTQASAEGDALADRVASLQATLSGQLGVPGFASGVPLPGAPIGEADLANYLTNPAGPFDGRPLEARAIFLLGDMEVGAAYTWLDRWDPSGRRGGARSALEARVRLPTGYLDLPDHFFDLGSGERQTDLEVALITDLAAGRVGARLTGRYVRQFAGTQLRRVAPPAQPLAPADRLARVRRDPGDIVAVGVQPYFRLTPWIALALSGTHWERGEDRYAYASPADALPGVEAEVLEEGTGAGVTTVGAGITYASPGLLDPNGRGLPVEARWSYDVAVRGSGGRAPKARTMRAELRLYWRLF